MKRLILIILFWNIVNVVTAQSSESKRMQNLKILTSVIFQGTSSTEKLYKCISFEKNDSLSDKERLKLFEDYIGQIRKNKSQYYTNSSFQYIPYLSLIEKYKIEFSSLAHKDIYAILNKDVPILYVLFKDNMIQSFDYFQKGENGPAYFVTY